MSESPSVVTEQVAPPQEVSKSEVVTSDLPKEGGAEERNWLTYVFIGVLTVALVLLLYYAYGRFVSNSIEEPMTKGVEQERDDPVVDFNLREAIRDLQNIQKQVLGTLSETMNI